MNRAWALGLAILAATLLIAFAIKTSIGLDTSTQQKALLVDTLSQDSGIETKVRSLKAQYANGFRDFSIEYHSVSGNRFGSVAEWQTELKIQGDGTATLFRRRCSAELPIPRPGLFTGALAESDLLLLLTDLESGEIRSLAREHMGPRDPLTRLAIRIGKDSAGYTWGVSTETKPEGMQDLIHRLANWQDTLSLNPTWSLELEVESISLKKDRFSAQLQVKNLGRETIRIAHPSGPGFGHRFGLYLEYGEQQELVEGYTPDPIEFTKAPFAAKPTSKNRMIEIAPERPFTLKFSARLEGRAPRGWIGGFTFRHYLDADTLDGKPVFNGALFSKELKW